jgi:hypothetical protein
VIYGKEDSVLLVLRREELAGAGLGLKIEQHVLRRGFVSGVRAETLKTEVVKKIIIDQTSASKRHVTARRRTQ